MEKPFVIGIDIGGTNTVFGIVNARGEVLSQNAIKTATHSDINLYISELYKELSQLLNGVGGKEKIRGIGICAPNGNFYTGEIGNAANLRWKGKIPLARMISEKFALPAALTNDANATATGEMTYGVARGMKHFIMITLGTGVGSGIVIDGKVVYGHDGFAGELGHVTAVRDGGRLCGCGKHGCLECYASATGVAHTAQEMLKNGNTESLLHQIPAEEITSKDVYVAAVQGDKMALEIFNFTGKMLGEAFADFVAFSAPEAIILFGGLTQAGDLLLKPIVENMEKNLVPMWRGKVKVLFSELGEADAAILGASALAWEI